MRVILILMPCMSLTRPAAAADMEVDTAATAKNDSLAFDPNAQSPTLPPAVPDGSDPSPVIDDTLMLSLSELSFCPDKVRFGLL